MIKTLSDALAERGYDQLTEVQEAVTAPGLEHADLLVSAQTGSGKTVGFGLAIAPSILGEDEMLGRPETPVALVVAPTRELAFQVMRELGWLYAKAGARVVSCVGGMDMRDERRALERGAHIVVGTPGRLRDHIQRNSLDLSAMRAVVLDEADEMLDLGFREDLEFILAAAPEDRRTLLFSATVPPMIAKLAQQFQKDAVRVTTVSGKSQHADISYQAIRVAPNDAESAIFNLLRFHDARNAIIFANTRAAVNHLAARLANRNFSVVSLSGELSQSERTHALQAMRDGRARVCVATDVAARGIDLPNLELVIHAELPSNSEALLHRSGRTGRAGRKGTSALIVPPKLANKAERLLKFAKITAEWTEAPSADDVLRRDEDRLLNDPAWDDEPTETQAAFAARLLDLHSPEKIAAAYLRQYHAARSAPEDLSPPDAKQPPKERKPFGPSAWVALSVGRDDRAEPRWLLPMLCRAGNLQKDDIGAIRIQQSESFVELAEASVDRFLSALGDKAELEEGVTVRRLDSAPDLKPAARGPRPDRPERPARPERHNAPERKPRPTPAEPAAEPRQFTPRPAPRDDADKPTRKVWDKDKPRSKGKPGDKPFSKGKPAGDRPEKAKHWDKPTGKPGGGKPWEKSGDKPRGKPRSNDDSRPKRRPADEVTPFRKGASDPSHRMERPGKPGGKPAGKPGFKGGKPGPRKAGGSEPPRRPKR
ncbi:DEAD/DEAH box helicase [Marivivens marinus]|uniref:DEAD/DEAH box helicase n=1 Tax=Marivivens marinus TaxID=3110173 RepID=UPI003B84847E